MNIKLHTPKSLKMGSGMSSMKQFLLSILATTVSIALTFGTAAIIDHQKKQSEKREIVMMVMYDMYNTLQTVAKADSMIHQSMDIQLQMAKDTAQFESLKFRLIHLIPMIDYTETTERIFSSNIETINTVGNMIFTEIVAEFYQARRYYKTMVCDSIVHRFKIEEPHATLKDALNFDFFVYAITSNEFLMSMQPQFEQCKEMMEVTDEELDVYRMRRTQLENTIFDKEMEEKKTNEILQFQKTIDKAKEKLKLK